MTETKQIPRPAMANWRERQFCLERAEKIHASAAEVAQKISDTEQRQKEIVAEHTQGEAYLKELRKQLADAGREHAQEVADAKQYERFVQAWADEDNDGQLPPPVDEVAMSSAAANPVPDLSFSMPHNVQDSRQPADDPLRSGVYPPAPTVPDGPYGGDGVEDARFHPRSDRHPGAGGQRA